MEVAMVVSTNSLMMPEDLLLRPSLGILNFTFMDCVVVWVVLGALGLDIPFPRAKVQYLSEK